MKRICSIFLIICLCIPFLTSCSLKPKSADELWEKINETMEHLQSYESNSTGNLALEVMNVPITADLTIKNIISGTSEKDYYYYSASEVTVKTESDLFNQSETAKFIEAFHDGKMFFSMESEKATQKFSSVLSAKEHIAYLEKQSSSSDDFDFNKCTTSSFTQNEDKTWSLHYSGYSNKALDRMFDTFDFDGEMFDLDLSDMEVTIQADNKFRIKEIKIKFIFNEDIDGNPVFEITMQYSNYNEAEKITDTINPENYKEIADCRLLTDFEDMIEKLEEDKDGSFVMEMEETLSVFDQKETYTETDTVSYGEKDGKYFYDISINSTSYQNMKISFENGKQTIKLSGKQQTNQQSTLEAKTFINSLINTAQYSMIYVSDIKKLEEGVYEVQCNNLISEAYEAIFESYTGELISFQKTLKITVKEGCITKIESDTLAEGLTKIGNNPHMQIHLVTVNTFNP